MSATDYRFTSQWVVPASPGRTFDVLADVLGYPDWWPQVRAVARVDDSTVRVVCRSVLPYDLDLLLTRVVEDRHRGVLEASIEGPLRGWSRWTLQPAGGAATRLDYEQEVTTSGRLLGVASRVARPVLVANHAWMMRGGRRGLCQGRSRAGR